MHCHQVGDIVIKRTRVCQCLLFSSPTFLTFFIPFLSSPNHYHHPFPFSVTAFRLFDLSTNLVSKRPHSPGGYRVASVFPHHLKQLCREKCMVDLIIMTFLSFPFLPHRCLVDDVISFMQYCPNIVPFVSPFNHVHPCSFPIFFL